MNTVNERESILSTATPRSATGHPVHHHRAGGQSLVMLALALPVLTGIVSLSVDVANFYFNWFALQRAADTAVLSGAVYLPAYPQQAISTANSYAALNGIKNGEIVSTAVSNSNMQLSMTVTRSVVFTFSRVLGVNNGVATASATAQVISVGKADGVNPLGVDYTTPRTYGQVVNLHVGVGPGNWGALALNGSGSGIYQNNIINGASGPITVGQTVNTEPGNMKGPTQSAVNTRISNGQTFDPGGTFANHQLNDPRVLTVPMVDWAGVQGNSTVPVKGFAELWLVSVDANATITTYFIEQTAPNTQALPGVETYGAYTPLLTM
jgi:Flp pilus assembly protein TadG